jgi:hypothetical protein
MFFPRCILLNDNIRPYLIVHSKTTRPVFPDRGIKRCSKNGLGLQAVNAVLLRHNIMQPHSSLRDSGHLQRPTQMDCGRPILIGARKIQPSGPMHIGRGVREYFHPINPLFDSQRF